MAIPLSRLGELLKKKGIGPEGSKNLKEEELSELSVLLMNPDYSLTTKATILTAFLILPATEAEERWLGELKKTYSETLPEPLHFLFNHQTQHPLQDYLMQTIGGNNLSYTKAAEAMNAILHATELPELWKGAFLEAQRLKRESFDENKAFFDVLWKSCERVQTNLPVILDISDNYDGFNRYHNFSVFFAATLAALGYPCIIHGTDTVAPKFGITHHQIIQALKGNIQISCSEASKRLANPDIRWAYIDQSMYAPSIWKLKQIRMEMIKRPFLATFEKLMQPVRAEHGNYIMTGFTHAHYRTEVAVQLKAQGTSKAAMVIKGIEGSSCPPLNRETIQVIYRDGIITDQSIHPSAFIEQSIEQLPAKDIPAEQTAALGVAALQGEKNSAWYQTLYYCSMVISGFNLEHKPDILKRTTEVLSNGRAYEYLKRGLF